MKKNSLITDATRQAFVDAFLQLHKKKPLSKIKVREIVEITGNNRSTFYRYFEDVYAVYDYIQECVFAGIAPRIVRNVLTQTMDDHFISDFVEIYEEWKDYIEVILSETSVFGVPERLRILCQKFSREEFNLDLQDVKTAYLFDCYLAIVITAFRRWTMNKDELPPEQLASLMQNLLNRGILPQLRGF